MIPTILAIAGSDPTGGAGIQADLKTTTAIGVYGAAAITCVTVQNSLGVSRVEPLPPLLVAQQVHSVLNDHFVSHIKIGMVGTLAVAETLGNILDNFTGEVVYDPVLTSTTGQHLFESALINKLEDALLAKVTVLTPNLLELAILAGKAIDNENQALESSKILLQRYKKLQAIILKGAHSTKTKDIKDFIVYWKNDYIEIESVVHSRIKTSNTHGTGCTQATAFTSFHALSGNIVQAFRDSIGFMDEVIKKSAAQPIIRSTGRNGPLLHFVWKPKD